MRRLNDFLCEDTHSERFVTLILVCLDPVGRKFAYTSAGHISGYLLDRTGSMRRALDSTGFPLGLFPDAEFATSPEISMVDGDILLMLTDGVTETQDHDENFFGAERAIETVSAGRNSSSIEIVNGLRGAIDDFAANQTQTDDITAVVCKVLPNR
jgi:sigma-B regulation protein RsbU (phosphoserine phosphatase)